MRRRNLSTEYASKISQGRQIKRGRGEIKNEIEGMYESRALNRKVIYVYQEPVALVAQAVFDNFTRGMVHLGGSEFLNLVAAIGIGHLEHV